MIKQKILLLLIIVIGITILLAEPFEGIKEGDFIEPYQSAVGKVIQDQRFESVRSKIKDLVRKGEVASISVAVAENGKIVWEESFGWADREKRIKATPHTMYSLASISKPLTATGLMILVEKGWVDLNEPINKYLGQEKLVAYIDKSSNATVKRVLRHTSGLPIHWNYFYENDPYQPTSMEETINRYGIIVTIPGEIYQYSNLGYGILGYVISKVSSKSYSQFMKSEVFLPLGMTHTSVGIGKGLEAYAAQRYGVDQQLVPFYEFDHPAASAIFSSVHDLMRFGLFHLKCPLPDQYKILKDESIDIMQNDKDLDYPDKEYKLGFRVIEDDFGFRSVSHTGGMEGVSTEIKIIPSENIALVVLCNNRDSRIYDLDNEILAAMIPKFKENLRKREKNPKETVSPIFSPPSDLLGEWDGEIKSYSTIQQIKMKFQDDGDVHVKLVGQMETLLNDVSFNDGILTGRFQGEIKTEDASRFFHYIELRMKLYPNNRMSGYACANSGRWFGLGSWITMRKTSSD